MNKKIKNIILGSFIFILMITLVSCDVTGKIKVQFETNGGSLIQDVEVGSDKKLVLPSNPEKDKFAFKGWYTDSELTEAFDINSIITESIKLYAKWEAKLVVKFDCNEGSLINDVYVVTGDKLVKPTNPTKDGANFYNWYIDNEFKVIYDFNKAVTEGLTLFAKWETKSYTIKFVYEDNTEEEFNVLHGKNFVDVPSIPEKDGFVGTWSNFKFINVQDDVTVNLIYVDKDEVTQTEVKDTLSQPIMIRETLLVKGAKQDRYIFFSNSIIDFVGTYASIEVLSDVDFVSSNGTILTIGEGEGSFLLLCSLEDGRSAVFYCLVMPKITGFSFAGGLAEYARIAENYQASDYQNKVMGNYLVGYQNAFKIEYSIYSGVSQLDTDKVELAYHYELLVDGVYVAVEEEEILSLRDGNNLYFLPIMDKKVIRITVEPVNTLSSHGNDPVIAVVEINAGINVHNHEELKLAYADLNNTIINLHNNIEAKLDANQLNPDGSPLNYDANEQIKQLTAGLPTGDVYTRFSSNVENNKLVFNGNYFKIDGSDLPVVKYSGYPNQLGYVSQISETLYVKNVQVGIFYNGLFKLDGENVTTDGNNNVTYNNLTILGNTITPDVNYNQSSDKVKSEEELMSYNSGGYIAITNRYCGSTTNNVNIGYAIIGITCSFYSSKAVLNETYIYYSWANGCYGHGVDFFDLHKSYIKYSGGAAIHIEDTQIEGDNDNNGCYDPMVLVDKDTVIENWVSGEEAWFKAYGLNALIPTLKASLEGGLNTFGASMLEVREFNNNGKIETAEMFNFAIFARHSMNPETFVNAGPQYRFSISDNEIARAYNFRSTSAVTNILASGGAGGAYFFPIGAYSDEATFLQYYQELATQYVPILMGQGYTQQEAQTTVFGLAMKNAYTAKTTDYVELLYNIPTFGEICFITGYSLK